MANDQICGLSAEIRELAQMGLSGEWGRRIKPLGLALEDRLDVSEMSEDMKCAKAIRLLAELAPVRLEQNQLFVGSASVGEACMHQVPIYGQTSVSHTTLGFNRVLKEGLTGLRHRLQERMTRPADGKGRDLLLAMSECLDAFEVWLQRYRLAVEESDLKYKDRILSNLNTVPGKPPETFEQALQSLWLLFAFTRLCGNWSALGRLDEYLGPFLRNDLIEGRITLDEAREMVAQFWVNGTEWVGAGSVFGGSGDAQFYQNVVLGGVDIEGNLVDNESTYLILEVAGELGISDFPISVRISKRTSRKLLELIARVQRKGNGIVAVYNEDIVIGALCRFGYPLRQARTFANDGCWEAIIPGQTAFTYMPFDAVQIVQKALGAYDGESREYGTFEELYQQVLKGVLEHLDWHNEQADGFCKNGPAAPLVSLFIDDCIERARGYYDGGAKYSVFAPHIGGMANASNGLLAIKKLVYDGRHISLTDYVSALRANWHGHEELRKRVLNSVPTYGNDNEEADSMLMELYRDYVLLAERCCDRNGVLRPAGISTFGREIAWADQRGATPDGHMQGDILATNFSPSPGTDHKGPTAALNSYCKPDFTRLPNIGTLELKLCPESVKGTAGIDAMVGLMEALVRQGGCFLHIDVVDSDLLRDAQRNPDKYPNLAVRISGWSARFATMDKKWQDMVISRTQQRI